MRRVLRYCQLFAQLSSREKVWFVGLFVGSGIARAALLTLPFRRIVPYMGAHDQHGLCTTHVTQEQQLQAWRIGRLTAMAAKYTPWESTCLVQALGATWLLAYYNIPYVVIWGHTPPCQTTIKHYAVQQHCRRRQAGDRLSACRVVYAVMAQHGAAQDALLGHQVAWAVRAASRYLPWECTCLVQRWPPKWRSRGVVVPQRCASVWRRTRTAPCRPMPGCVVPIGSSPAGQALSAAP